jgi:hypothetical protein
MRDREIEGVRVKERERERERRREDKMILVMFMPVHLIRPALRLLEMV